MKIKQSILLAFTLSALALSANAGEVNVTSTSTLSDVWNVTPSSSKEVKLTENWVFNISSDAVLNIPKSGTIGIINTNTGDKYGVTFTGDGSVNAKPEGETNALELNFKNNGSNYILIDWTGNRFSVNSDDTTMYIGDGTHNVTVAGVMANTGTVNVHSGSTVTGSFNVCSVAKKSTVENGAIINVTAARVAYADINGTLTSGSIQTANGWRHSLAFGWIAANSETMRETKGGTYAKTVTLGATAKIKDTYATNDGAYFSVWAENLISNVDSTVGGKIESAAELHIYGSSTQKTTVTFNSKNAFNLGYADDTKKTFNTQGNSTFYLGENVSKVTRLKLEGDKDAVNHTVDSKLSANVIFDINADNDFGAIEFCYADATNTSTLELSTGGFNVTIGDIYFYNDFCSVILTDSTWVNDTLLLTSRDVAYWQDKIDNGQISYTGNTEGNLVAVSAIDGSGVYLNVVTAVPEPAEWAVILGALALGFVAYKRRK